MQNLRVFGIAAHGSNRGKTRLLLALLQEFTSRDLRVAVLKHGQHVYLPPDKDSSLFMQAGAQVALTVSPGGWLLSAAPEAEPDFDASVMLLRQSCVADLLLTEGYKHGPQMKLLLTEETLTEAQLLPRTVALVSEARQILPLPCFKPTDITGIADFIIDISNREGFDERFKQA